MNPDRRRDLPSVDRLLAHPGLAPVVAGLSRRAAVALVRREIGQAREELAAGAAAPDAEALAARCRARCALLDAARPRRVINATGVVLHTNLGRAPLAPAAIEAVAAAAAGYCDLEYDAARGERGSRQAHVADLLELAFPGWGALVVNNNAAALLLALNTVALGQGVVVSRGELVEIGGSFRVPEILERSGARLVEVGTTNRTHLSDYRRALLAGTAALLKVWPSNYRVIGFTAEVGVAELAALAGERGVPLIVDQGCGRLFPDAPGPRSEPAVLDLLEDGAGLVCFSGDKLLGGPQCGILVGAPELVARCAKNPLARALRPGRLTIAALAATLRLWLSADPLPIPVARMVHEAEPALRARAEMLAARLAAAVPGLEARVQAGVSRVGGGAAPEEDLPGAVIAVRVPGLDETELAARLRRGAPAIVVRTQGGSVVVDPRTVFDDETEILVRAFVDIACAR